MKTFEVTFENGATYAIKGNDWKKGTEVILKELRELYGVGHYEPWDIISIIEKEESKNDRKKSKTFSNFKTECSIVI